MKVDPDLQIINRTVNKQREAMLAKQLRKTTEGPDGATPNAVEYQVNNTDKQGVTPGAVDPNEKQGVDKKRRHDREGKRRHKSREKRKKERRHRSKK